MRGYDGVCLGKLCGGECVQRKFRLMEVLRIKLNRP